MWRMAIVLSMLAACGGDDAGSVSGTVNGTAIPVGDSVSAAVMITNNQHAATEYFKSTMSPELMTAFRPIVDSTIRTEGAAKDWSSIVNVYNKIPLISKPLEPTLTDFIAARAIDGMFSIVANEEEQIRSKVEYRKTDLMKKVFGYADQELAKKNQQTQ